MHSPLCLPVTDSASGLSRIFGVQANPTGPHLARGAHGASDEAVPERSATRLPPCCGRVRRSSHGRWMLDFRSFGQVVRLAPQRSRPGVRQQLAARTERRLRIECGAQRWSRGASNRMLISFLQLPHGDLEGRVLIPCSLRKIAASGKPRRIPADRHGGDRPSTRNTPPRGSNRRLPFPGGNRPHDRDRCPPRRCAKCRHNGLHARGGLNGRNTRELSLHGSSLPTPTHG